jgi:hypothetical protein
MSHTPVWINAVGDITLHRPLLIIAEFLAIEKGHAQ